MTAIEPEDRISGVLERTMYNLRFIERRRRPDGPFEVIQLINSFMGAAVHPWENLLSTQEELVNLTAQDVGWPQLIKSEEADDDPADFHEQLAWIRHAFAHGNIEYINEDDSIVGIKIRNKGRSRKQKKDINWGTQLDLRQLRALLVSYCRIAQRIDAHRRGSRGTLDGACFLEEAQPTRRDQDQPQQL